MSAHIPRVPMPAPPPARAAETGGSSLQGERHLVAAIERVVRAPHGWSAVAVHLSRLAAPGPRPHHRRVARAVMQESAERTEGQAFALRNGDVVLLYRDTLAAAAAVPEMLRRLFGREVEDPGTVVSEWRLPHAGAPLLAYTAERIAGLDPPSAEDGVGPPATIVDTVAAAVAGARPHDLVRRQPAVSLEPAASGAGVAMRQVYTELTFSLDALHASLHPPTHAPMRLGQDVALLLHLGRCFDQRMLRILQLDRGSGGPLDVETAPGERGGAAGDARPALHLNLSPLGVLSDEFSAFVEAGRGFPGRSAWRSRWSRRSPIPPRSRAPPRGCARPASGSCWTGCRIWWR